ncbi:MAG: hypothetical protein ACYSTF_09955 [Planctomycetota bacterium]
MSANTMAAEIYENMPGPKLQKNKPNLVYSMSHVAYHMADGE